MYGRSGAEQILNAHTMHSPKIYTYNVKNPHTAFEIYILCKGLNSGKPLDKPCPNCFVIACSNQQQRDFYYTICFALWKAKYFHQWLTGSVIPFLRIDDFKKQLQCQAENLRSKEPSFSTTVDQIKAIEQKEKQMLQQLVLLQDLKKAMLYRYLKR